MRERNGRSSRLLNTNREVKARIRIYESIVSIIVLMLWIVDVRSKMDVVLFLKSISNLYARKYISVIEMCIPVITVLRGNLKDLKIEMFYFISIL